MEYECEASDEAVPPDPTPQQEIRCPVCGRSVAIDGRHPDAYGRPTSFVIRRHEKIVGGER